MTFEFFISRRYFKSKSNQTIIALITLLSILGVAIGVSALIIVIAVMVGFESDLKSRILGIEPHLVIDTHGTPMGDYQRIVDRCRENKHVTEAWPVVKLQVMLKSQARVTGATIKGVAPQTAGKGLNLDTLDALSHPSSVPTETEGAGTPDVVPIVLGRSLGRTLGVVKGDPVYIISPKGALAPVGFVPIMKKFRVVDFFETGMYEYDGSLAFLNLADAQSLARLKSNVSAVEMQVDDIYRTQSIGRALISKLGPDYRFQDWIILNKNLFAALKMEKSAMFLTLTLIILVATFSIISSLVMMVIEKTKDIAILKTIGASNGSIQRLFVYQGLQIGFIGTASGVILGTLICWLQQKYQLVSLPGDVYYISALPVHLRFLDVLLVSVSALVICFLATLYPAKQASKLDPVEAIRYG